MLSSPEIDRAMAELQASEKPNRKLSSPEIDRERQEERAMAELQIQRSRRTGSLLLQRSIESGSGAGDGGASNSQVQKNGKLTSAEIDRERLRSELWRNEGISAEEKREEEDGEDDTISSFFQIFFFFPRFCFFFLFSFEIATANFATALVSLLSGQV
jgi:hypothetical protein